VSALQRFDRFNEKVALGLELIGLVALILLVFITTLDVLGAKLFSRPISGSLDAVMVSQVVAISFAAAITLIVGRHVEVEFLVTHFPQRIQIVLDILVKLACLLLFVIMVWVLTSYAHHLQVRHEVTPTVRFPLYPFGYIAALGCVPVCLVYVSLILQDILRLNKK
jgi:TRAP-type transport system small permease protein